MNKIIKFVKHMFYHETRYDINLSSHGNSGILRYKILMFNFKKPYRDFKVLGSTLVFEVPPTEGVPLEISYDVN